MKLKPSQISTIMRSIESHKTPIFEGVRKDIFKAIAKTRGSSGVSEPATYEYLRNMWRNHGKPRDDHEIYDMLVSNGVDSGIVDMVFHNLRLATQRTPPSQAVMQLLSAYENLSSDDKEIALNAVKGIFHDLGGNKKKIRSRQGNDDEKYTDNIKASKADSILSADDNSPSLGHPEPEDDASSSETNADVQAQQSINAALSDRGSYIWSAYKGTNDGSLSIKKLGMYNGVDVLAAWAGDVGFVLADNGSGNVSIAPLTHVNQTSAKVTKDIPNPSGEDIEKIASGLIATAQDKGDTVEMSANGEKIINPLIKDDTQSGDHDVDGTDNSEAQKIINDVLANWQHGEGSSYAPPVGKKTSLVKMGWSDGMDVYRVQSGGVAFIIGDSNQDKLFIAPLETDTADTVQVTDVIVNDENSDIETVVRTMADSIHENPGSDSVTATVNGNSIELPKTRPSDENSQSKGTTNAPSSPSNPSMNGKNSNVNLKYVMSKNGLLTKFIAISSQGNRVLYTQDNNGDWEVKLPSGDVVWNGSDFGLGLKISGWAASLYDNIQHVSNSERGDAEKSLSFDIHDGIKKRKYVIWDGGEQWNDRYTKAVNKMKQMRMASGGLGSQAEPETPAATQQSDISNAPSSSGMDDNQQSNFSPRVTMTSDKYGVRTLSYKVPIPSGGNILIDKSGLNWEVSLPVTNTVIWSGTGLAVALKVAGWLTTKYQVNPSASSTTRIEYEKKLISQLKPLILSHAYGNWSGGAKWNADVANIISPMKSKSPR